MKKPCRALVIAGSAGSLDVILKALPRIRTDLSFPLIVVLHRKNSYDSVLAELFQYKTKIPVKEVEDKQSIENGVIYIAPADYHLLLEDSGVFSLDASEKVNYSRPSIDVTFESAAEVYREALVCILLSGANADGVQGLKKVKCFGGTVAVQEPSSAEVPFMPEQAILHSGVDHILHTNDVAEFINGLV